MKIRTRIVLVFVLVVAAGFFFLVQWIADDLRPRYLESLEEPLVDIAHILAEFVASEFDQQALNSKALHNLFQNIYQRRFHARIYALDKQQIDMRVYITDTHGIVLFDSAAGRDEGKDYSRWNDVYLTLQGQYGARATSEDPLNPESSVLYIAAPIMIDGQLVGVISVGKPAHNADRFIAVATHKLAIAGFIATLVVLTVGLALYAWVSLPLEKLIRYASAIKAGERVALPKLGHNEIGIMGAAIEEMRSALAGKDYAQRYVQTLTHELKSPLAAIRGAAELLDEDMPSEPRQRFLANIRTETQRLQDLVDRMLELAAVEKRQSLESSELIELDQLIADVVASSAPLITLKHITLDTKLDDKPAKYTALRGERFLLRQAIANLLLNALEFSPPGGLVTIANAYNQQSVTLSIADNGPGIPMYALSKVFDRFFSLQRPDGAPKSTGLGLSFVREVAELHGGTIHLDNRERSPGAVATLTLPLKIQ